MTATRSSGVRAGCNRSPRSFDKPSWRSPPFTASAASSSCPDTPDPFHEEETMPLTADQILDLPFDVQPDPDEFIRAAMEWHFNPESGCKFWLDRAATLGFDPRADVKTHEDLRLFPNMAAELRDVRGEDLIPRGYGNQPDVVGFFESGGTTGAPKRVV